MSERFTEKDMTLALQERFNPDKGYVSIPQYRVRHGFAERGKHNIIDLMVYGLWSKDQNVYAFEIKVSRQDFINDITAYHTKHKEAFRLSNCFYYAVPHGLVTPEEIPEESGLIYVNTGGKTMIKKVAPIRKITDLVKADFQALVASRYKSEQNGVKNHYITFLGKEITPEAVTEYIENEIRKKQKAIEDAIYYRQVNVKADEMVKDRLSKIEGYEEKRKAVADFYDLKSRLALWGVEDKEITNTINALRRIFSDSEAVINTLQKIRGLI